MRCNPTAPYHAELMKKIVWIWIETISLSDSYPMLFNSAFTIQNALLYSVFT
ncbi:hypothetical protein [Acinetobacter wuhouensis]|uniref:hypothetical protein n=1 Tax=Acinetobacter wuhouensis TaxID=1879050 RepID=UPI0013750FD9|nr:hypothetical protein [Acinetobacter wuhouensis]